MFKISIKGNTGILFHKFNPKLVQQLTKTILAALFIAGSSNYSCQGFHILCFNDDLKEIPLDLEC